jgi:hypothetical protein
MSGVAPSVDPFVVFAGGPAQIAAYAAAAALLPAFLLRGARWPRLAAGVLAILWLWTAISYHWLLFEERNPVAIAFGCGFAVEAILLARSAFGREPRLGFVSNAGARGRVGVVLIVYCFVVYPLLAVALAWPPLPRFALPPAPIVLLTLALLLQARPAAVTTLWPVPIGWALIAGPAALLFGIVQDWMLIVAGLVTLMFALRARTRVGRDASPPRRKNEPRGAVTGNSIGAIARWPLRGDGRMAEPPR